MSVVLYCIWHYEPPVQPAIWHNEPPLQPAIWHNEQPLQPAIWHYEPPQQPAIWHYEPPLQPAIWYYEPPLQPAIWHYEPLLQPAIWHYEPPLQPAISHNEPPLWHIRIVMAKRNWSPWDRKLYSAWSSSGRDRIQQRGNDIDNSRSPNCRHYRWESWPACKRTNMCDISLPICVIWIQYETNNTEN